MRKLFVLMILFIPFLSPAQNVGIGTNTPDPSAMLDITSTTKGLLIPRMTTTERTSIPGPTIGLVVFDNTTYSFWIYRGDVNGGWAELLTGLDKHWDVLGSNIFNLNVGNVGIGTNNPQQKLTINAINPSIQMMNDGNQVGFLSTSGTHLKLATNSANTTGSLVLSTQGADRVTITKSGQVGFGTTTPVSDITLNGAYPTIQIQDNGANIGFLESGINSTNLKIGTNSTNTTGNLVLQTRQLDRVTIDENGLVGIGTTTPTSILSINAADPIVQLKNSGVDKGFIQLVGDDIKAGTNITNNNGRFIIRTNGADRVTVDNTGRVGIGINPTYPLDVNGTARVSGDMRIGGEGFSAAHTLSSATPELAFDETDVGLFVNASLKFEGGVFKIGKTFNGGNIVIDANTSSSSKRFYLSKANQFNFGTGIFATGYTLSVEGKVIATDFTTLAVSSWPDYVFRDDYRLRPLSEVQAFIREHKHLPDIPSAAQIEKEGIPLGDMSKRLMEKVEELTLYILRQQQQIDELKKQVEGLQKND